MGFKYPGMQYMVSCDTPESIQERHKSYLRQFECPETECVIQSMEEVPEWDHLRQRYGYKCRYQLHWASHAGWRVYMYHTGCIAL